MMQKKNKIFRETQGREIRSYIHVKDVAKLLTDLFKKNMIIIIIISLVKKIF